MAHLKNKMRVLWVAKILWTETDEDNPITASELVECLNSMGVSSSVNTIYEDVEAVRRVLFPVKLKGQKRYYSVKEETHADGKRN